MAQKIQELGQKASPKEKLDLQLSRLMIEQRRKLIQVKSIIDADNVQFWAKNHIIRIVNEYITSINVDKTHIL